MPELLRSTVRSLRAHALRYGLTSLGILWGAFMLTFLSGNTEGTDRHFRHELEESALKNLGYIHTRNTRAHAVFNRRYYRRLGRFHLLTFFGRRRIVLVPGWIKRHVSEPATSDFAPSSARALSDFGD